MKKLLLNFRSFPHSRKETHLVTVFLKIVIKWGLLKVSFVVVVSHLFSYAKHNYNYNDKHEQCIMYARMCDVWIAWETSTVEVSDYITWEAFELNVAYVMKYQNDFGL
jgi:hypothetical protein